MSTQNLPLTNSSRRSKLAFAALAMALAGVITPASAANFQYRHLVYGLTAPVSIGSQAQQAAAEIVVALTGGPALPAGEVDSPYSYDLKQLLSVTGDSNWSASNVSWNLPSGSLPQGLSLGTDGVISGMPTSTNDVGASFQVKASYKGKDGQQVYTIVVNGAVLRVTQISAGDGHTCVLTAKRGVKCWGDNSYGQLGNNSTVRSLTPVDVYGLTSGVAQISAGSGYTCAVTEAGGAKCWGYNNTGQLGDNSVTSRLTPVDVYGLTAGVALISSAPGHACAVTKAGGAKCWGNNTQGQLGDGSTTSRKIPVDVSGHTTGVAHISSSNLHSCLVTTEGGAKCWGFSGQGRLGTGTSSTYVPVNVSGLTSGVSSITTGTNHSCVVTVSGSAKCWGYNYYGQLGSGTTTTSSVPVAVVGLASGVTHITAGYSHTCALTTEGSLKCWGSNAAGQLGDNSLVNRTSPVSVSGLTSSVASITGGADHTCVATVENKAQCWGSNSYGQLGNNSTTNSLVPVDVSPY